MADYGGFEKVGYLGHELPSQDEEITTSPGDIVLYQGNQIVIFYDSNTWSYTPLGHIENLEMLKKALGSGDIEIVLSLDWVAYKGSFFYNWINKEREIKISEKDKQDSGLADLIEGLAGNDAAAKLGETIENVTKNVDLNKIGDTVNDFLAKTDIDDKLMEKGGDLVNDLLGHLGGKK